MAAPDNELDPTRIVPASLPNVITAHVHALGELGLTDLALIADVIKDDPLEQLKFAAALAISGDAVDLDKLDTVTHRPLSVVEISPKAAESTADSRIDRLTAGAPAAPANDVQRPHDDPEQRAQASATPPGFKPLKSMFGAVFPDDADISRLQGLSPVGRARFSRTVEEVYLRNAKIPKYAPVQARRASLFMEGHAISEAAKLAGESAGAISQSLTSVRGILGREADTLRQALDECERLVPEDTPAVEGSPAPGLATSPSAAPAENDVAAAPTAPVAQATRIYRTPQRPVPDRDSHRLEDWGDQIFDMCAPHWDDDDVESLLALLVGETGEATGKARAHISVLLDRYAPHRPGTGMQNQAKLTGVEWGAWRRLVAASSPVSLDQVREKYSPRFARLGGEFGSSMVSGLRKLVDAESAEHVSARPAEPSGDKPLPVDDIAELKADAVAVPEPEAHARPLATEAEVDTPEVAVDLPEDSVLPEPESEQDITPETELSAPASAQPAEISPSEPVDLSALPDPLKIGRDRAMNPRQIAELFGVTEKQLRRGIDRLTAKHAFYGKTAPVTRGDETGRRTAHFWGSGLEEVFQEARRIVEGN